MVKPVIISVICNTLIILGLLFLFLVGEENQKTILLLGGAKIPTETFSLFSGKRFVVITTNIEYSKQSWNKLNVIEYVHPRDFRKKHVDMCDGIVIAGGDQFEYLANLNADLVQECYNNDKIIIGISAGAMILGEHIFTAEKGTITSEEAENGIGITLSKFVCIKELKGCIIDSHFSERKRYGRLIAFMQKCKAKIGIGIDEDTGLLISNGKKTKLGTGRVSEIF